MCYYYFYSFDKVAATDEVGGSHSLEGNGKSICQILLIDEQSYKQIKVQILDELGQKIRHNSIRYNNATTPRFLAIKISQMLT